jgi:hypothetical protein
MYMAPNCVASSLTYADDQRLLACRIHDTTSDFMPIVRNGSPAFVASLGREERRGELIQREDGSVAKFWRTPLPLNMRHGHYMAHTATWKEIGGQSLEFNNTYFSMDYHLAARWILHCGDEDVFEFGGGMAYHMDGIREKARDMSRVPDGWWRADEAESPENKMKVQNTLDAYCATFGCDCPRWIEPHFAAMVGA